MNNKNTDFRRILKLISNKQVILVALIGIVIITGTARYLNTNKAVETSGSGDILATIPLESMEPVIIKVDEILPTVDTNLQSDYFTTSRMDRDQSRSRAVEILSGILESSLSTSEERRAAQEDISKISFSIETEAVIESLIRAKSFNEVVVFITDAGVNVVVQSNGITAAQAAQIKDIVMENVKVEAANVKILEIK